MNSNSSRFHENLNRKQSLTLGSDKKFGFTFAFVFLFLFFTSVFKHQINFYFLSVSVFYILNVFYFKKFLSWQNKKWMQLGLFLQKIFSPIILFFLFFGVITPTALLLKVFKKDILNLKPNKSSESYWITSELKATNMTEQF